MQFTWFTFPLFVGGFSITAICLSANMKEASLRINQVDLVDVDLAMSSVRGSTWADMYSPCTETYSLQWHATQPLSSIAPDLREVASWQGLPGTGLGGLNTSGSAPVFTEPYRIVLDRAVSRLEDTPIQVSATKSFQVRWWGTTKLNVPSLPTVDSRNRLLTGEITNPLPIALEECAVLFGNWLYRLDSKFGTLAPGESVRIESETLLDLEWKLTRRRRVQESHDVSTPWDQNSIDIPRILEMMMFHESAGGETYTQLSHRYQSYVDLSHLLQRGRAILLGRSKQRAADLQIGGEDAETHYDQTWTYYRIVFPVRSEESG
jgi:hypothetical protein